MPQNVLGANSIVYHSDPKFNYCFDSISMYKRFTCFGSDMYFEVITFGHNFAYSSIPGIYTRYSFIFM